MTPAVGPFMIAAALLVVGGVAKAVRPVDTANALRAVGFRAPATVVRLGGAGEALLGVYAIGTGSRLAAALVGVSFAAFAAFVVVALRRGTPLATCGCFGREDAPPSRLHVGVNLGAVIASVAVAVDPGAGIADVVGDQPLAGAPFVLLLLTGTVLALLALTTLPRVLALASTGLQDR